MSEEQEPFIAPKQSERARTLSQLSTFQRGSSTGNRKPESENSREMEASTPFSENDAENDLISEDEFWQKWLPAKIDKNVPVPLNKTDMMQLRIEKLAELEPTDSFLFPANLEGVWRGVIKKMYGMSEYADYKFMIREINEMEKRLWRL